MTVTTQETAQQKTRVLILYEDAGAGHKRVAEIAAEVFPHRTHVVSLHSGSRFFNDSAGVCVVWFWNTLVRWNWIRVADWLVNGFIRCWVFPIIETLITDHYETLAREKPDMVVSTADGWNKLLGTYCVQHNIPFSIIHTEVSVYQDLVHQHATHICYFAESIEAVQSYDFSDAYHSIRLTSNTGLWTRINYIRRMYVEHIWRRKYKSIYRGIDQLHRKANKAKCVAIGPIVGREFVSSTSTENDRPPCVLVMSGSIGGSFVVSVTQYLVRHWVGAMRLVAVCGCDRRSQRILDKTAAREGSVDLEVHGFVEDMSRLYQSANLTIARPSSGVVFEALACGSRLLVPEIVTSNDRGNVDIILKNGWGATFEKLADIPEKVATQLKYEPVSSMAPEHTRKALGTVLLRTGASTAKLYRRKLNE